MIITVLLSSLKCTTEKVIIGLGNGGRGVFVVRSIETNRIDKLYSRGRPTV